MERYQALFEPAEEGGFVVTFPDFDFGATQGDSEEEAMEMAVDALAIVITSYIENDKPLPKPARRRGRKYRSVELPTIQRTKAELYRIFEASRIRKVELARLFDLNYNSRMDQIEAAFRALGKVLDFEVRDAA